jgi:TPR repeat protein
MARLDMATHPLVDMVAQGATPDALFELGVMYCSGRDVDPDLIEAHKWFNLAALRGNESARRYRQEISAEMSKAEIARAQKLARDWLSCH